MVQFEGSNAILKRRGAVLNTLKAFANFSPEFERSENPGG